jgi:malate dehydrogenase (oxaloacetate-decarboxylating)(NADP+)
MDEFMDEFMDAMKEVFPNLLVQFEDFSTDNAFRYLDRFREKYRCFNDDIQGTGSVVLSGFLNAADIASQASGRALSEHRILFFGAGSAGIGVAKQLLSFFKFQGMNEADATKQIWTVDSKGLITAGRPGLQEHKKFFARTDYQGPPLTNLVDIINYVKPTALFGLSTLRVSISLLPWVPYGEFCAYRMRSQKKSSRRWHRTTRVRLSSRCRIRCR